MSISPLRQRMIDDMTARHFGEKAQKDYIRCVKNLAAFIGRAPETAMAEDLRLYRLHLVQSPLGAASVNSAMTALGSSSALRSTGTSFASLCSASSSPGSCPRC